MPGMTAAAASAGLALHLGRRIAEGAACDVRAGVRSRRRARGRPHADPGPGVRLTGFDPLSTEVIADPYPWYERLLAGPRVHYNPRRRLWILCRHEDVRAAAHAHGELSSAEGVTFVRRPLPMLLTIDRPEHARLRRVVARHFTHDALARRRPAIEEIAERAIERAMGRERCDAVSELAAPVPVEVIAEILGVPRADRGRFRRWSDQIVIGFNLAPGNLARTTASVLPAIFRLHAYFDAVFAARRAAPADDLISHLARSSAEGRLSAEELFWFALLLLVAGNETTTNLIGTMLLTLADLPDVHERVRDQPALLPAAVEESLRLHSPIQSLYRTAIGPYPVGEATVPAGERVLLLFAAANRDPRRYAQPGSFDLDRDCADHLAFGAGIHFCLGAHLARLEASAVLRRVLARARRIELTGEPVWTRNPALRGLQRLPVRFVPATARRSPP
jgi:beta-dihydromenaquinone-9 omega-hydroxylase